MKKISNKYLQNTSVVLTFSPQINNINFRLALTDVAAVPQSSGYGTAHPKTSSS
jgi:hypothetical protein